MKLKIETKFGVNDLVASKWVTDTVVKNQMSQIPRFYEVMGVICDTCSAGTQIYYTLRPFEISKAPSYGKEHGDYLIGPMHTNPEAFRMREDELVPFDITPFQVVLPESETK